MKIIIAPDSFKESLSALDVATEIRNGFVEIFPEAHYVLLPVADGGEGTVDALVAATNGKRISHVVTGPLGRDVNAFYGLSGDSSMAVLEMAAAAGLMLVPFDERNPLVTTTYGFGELFRVALDAGARRFVVGIGGSATNDGGAGMIQALGGRLLDAAGIDLAPGGGSLADLVDIDLTRLDPRLSECRIDVACDVNVPLVGPDGASAVFGPQKGATPAMVEKLDYNLRHFASVVHEQLGIDVKTTPGGGAAGGLGAGMQAFLGASLRPGVEIVMQALGLDEAVRDADLVITGEGRMDSQTVRGKAPAGVAAAARRHGRRVIGIAGSLGAGVEDLYPQGMDAVFSVLATPCTVVEALAAAASNIRRTARNVAATLAVGGLGGGFIQGQRSQ